MDSSVLIRCDCYRGKPLVLNTEGLHDMRQHERLVFLKKGTSACLRQQLRDLPKFVVGDSPEHSICY